MNIYFISQNENRGYDTYDSAVVAAAMPRDARNIHPSFCNFTWSGNDWETDKGYPSFDDWTSPDNVNVEFIGVAKEGTEPGVICSSYNAG
jgi:hypothetical protein